MAENMCIFCQEYKEDIGHVTTSCPYVKCKNCDQKGHFKMNCEIDEMEDGLEVELIDVKSTLNSDNFIKVKDIKSLTKIVEEDKGESGKIDALSFYLCLVFLQVQKSFGLAQNIWTSTKHFGTCKRTRH